MIWFAVLLFYCFVVLLVCSFEVMVGWLALLVRFLFVRSLVQLAIWVKKKNPRGHRFCSIFLLPRDFCDPFLTHLFVPSFLPCLPARIVGFRQCGPESVLVPRFGNMLR